MTFPTKSEFVYESIKELIASGKWLPGQRYSVVEIAEKLGISRTPVSEAIKLLAFEGFVKLLPNKGFEVRRLSLEEIEEILQIRSVLEGLASYKAALNIEKEEIMSLKDILKKHEESLAGHNLDGALKTNEELHFTIHRLGRSPHLQKMLRDLWGYGQWYWTRIKDQPDKLLLSCQEHRQLVEAIVNKRPLQARQIAEEHIARYCQELMERLKELYNSNTKVLELEDIKDILLAQMQFAD